MTNKKTHVDMFAISIYSKTNVTFVKNKKKTQCDWVTLLKIKLVGYPILYSLTNVYYDENIHYLLLNNYLLIWLIVKINLLVWFNSYTHR
jgi:hypothetical protein